MFEVNQLESNLPDVSPTTPPAAQSDYGSYAGIGFENITPPGNSGTPYRCAASVERLDSIDDLPRKLRKWVKTMIRVGYNKDAPDKEIIKGFNEEKAKQGIAPTAKPYPSRSEAVYAAIGYCKFAGVSDGVLLNILTDPRWQISAHCIDNGGESYARKQIEQWRREHPQFVEQQATGDGQRDIPAGAIIVEGGKLLTVIADAEKLLIDNRVPIYQRGTSLVHPVRLDKKQAEQMLKSDDVQRRPGSLVLLEMTKLGIVRLLSEHGTWYGRLYGELVACDPPDNVASHILDKKGEWNFDVVKGITPAPTLRSDGTILQTPGYDAASQLIFDPGGVTFDPVPENPTPDDARDALQTLLHPVRKFPFVAEADKSIWLAALLTAVVRQAIRTAPLFGFDAPAAGTGKSMLCEMIGVIVLGDVPPLINPSPNDEEFSKQLGAVLLRGDPIIWFDNVLRTLGNNETLCSMFTNPDAVSIRVLGQSKMPSCPAYCTVLASGKNLGFSEDMTRRALRCKLDAGVERPELRKFDFDPLDEVRADRMKLLIAALTIVRAYIVAGRPKFALEAFGSFADFDLIRSALTWVGMPDPCSTRMEMVSEDDARHYVFEAFREWHALIGESPVTIKTIRDSWLNAQTKYETLIDALKIITKLDTHAGFDPLRVGQRLKKYKGQICGGFKLQCTPDRKGVAEWSVFQVDREGQQQAPQLFAETSPPPADSYADYKDNNGQ